MRYYTPLTDTIDRRNFRESVRKSIIKRYNVNFVVPNEGRPIQQAEQKESESQILLERMGTTAREVEILEASESNQELVFQQEDDEAIRKAKEIVERLMAEAEADSIAKGKEWEEKIASENIEAEKKKFSASSAEVNSGISEQDEVDEAAQRIADTIRQERDNQVKTMFDVHSERD